MVDVLVVADVVSNETTDLATHLAPCAGQLERADLTLGVDQYLPAVAAQYTEAVVQPAKSRRQLWWILGKLLEELGYEPIQGGPSTDECTAEGLMALALSSSPADLDVLMQAPTAVVAHDAVFGWVRRNIEKRGGWRLAPTEMVTMLADLADPVGLVLIPRRQLKHVNSQLVGTVDMVAGQDEPQVLVSASDARDANLAEGDVVEVRSPFGAVRAVVHLDSDIVPGAVSVPHGFAGTNVNQLTSSSDHVDSLTGMPLFSGVPLTLTKV